MSWMYLGKITGIIQGSSETFYTVVIQLSEVPPT